MPTPSQQFFEEYARAYESQDAYEVANLYFIPAVIMSDDRKNVFTNLDDVADQIRELMDKLEDVGVVHYEPEVCQSMKLSENIMFSNVKWTFLDSADEIIFTCMVSYTLQVVEDSLKIIVTVIDDEERELEKLL